MLLSNSAYLNGQVVRYGAAGHAERHVAFPPTTDPIAIEMFDQYAIIADIAGFALYSITGDEDPALFGGKNFLNYLAERAQARGALDARSSSALAHLIAGVLLAVALYAWGQKQSGMTINTV